MSPLFCISLPLMETLPRADARAATNARFAGTVVSGTGLTVQSTSDNDAIVVAETIGVSVFGAHDSQGVSKIWGTAGTEGSVTGSVTLTSGAVNVSATSGDDASTTLNGVSGTAINLGRTLPTADALGETRAFIGQGANVTADSVNVTASGTTNATAILKATNIGLLLTIAQLTPTATAGGVVEAFIGQQADSNSTGSSTRTGRS